MIRTPLDIVMGEITQWNPSHHWYIEVTQATIFIPAKPPPPSPMHALAGFLRVPGWNQGEGVVLGNPKDSVWEDWGSPYREDYRGITTTPRNRILLCTPFFKPSLDSPAFIHNCSMEGKAVCKGPRHSGVAMWPKHTAAAYAKVCWVYGDFCWIWGRLSLGCFWKEGW